MKPELIKIAQKYIQSQDADMKYARQAAEQLNRYVVEHIKRINAEHGGVKMIDDGLATPRNDVSGIGLITIAPSVDGQDPNPSKSGTRSPRHSLIIELRPGQGFGDPNNLNQLSAQYEQAMKKAKDFFISHKRQLSISLYRPVKINYTLIKGQSQLIA